MSLPSSGERFLPGEMPGDIELEHLHRYHLAADFAVGKSVLDLACGEGYGSYLLAGNAARVIGMDVSAEAIHHASRKYVRDNLSFRVGACEEIPLEAASVDLIVSFETIEHHDQHESMLQEFRRVLRPDGLLIISSPDKFEYSDVTGSANAYHVKELHQEEFLALVRKFFSTVRVAGQRVLHGSLICIGGEELGAPFRSLVLDHGHVVHHSGLARPLYALALASNAGVLPKVAHSLFERREKFSLTQQLVWANEAVSESKANFAALQAELSRSESELRRCLDEVAASRVLVGELIAERALQRDVLHQLLSGSNSLRARFDETDTRVENEVRAVVDEVRRVVESHTSEKQSRAALHEEIKRIGAALENLQNLGLELRDEVSKARTSDSFIQDLIERVTESEASGDRLREANSRLHGLLDAASRERSDLEAKVESFGNENDHLSAVVLERDETIRQHLEEIQIVEAARKRCEEELAFTKRELEAVRCDATSRAEQQEERYVALKQLNAALSASMLDSSAQLKELIAVSQSADERAEALQHRVDALQSSLAAEIHGSELLRQQVASLLNSRSWRLTKPVRKITDRLRQSKAGLEVGRAILKLARSLRTQNQAQNQLKAKSDFRVGEVGTETLSIDGDGSQATQERALAAAEQQAAEVVHASMKVSGRREQVLAAVLRRAAALKNAQGPITHIFALPLLSSGGAEQTLASICRLLNSMRPGCCSQLILVTDLAIDTTAVSLPASSLVIDISKELPGSSLEERQLLLLDCIRLLEPRVFHCINSEAGWRLIINYSELISSKTALVGSMFAFQFDWESGKRIGYAETFLSASFHHLDWLITDNQRFLNDAEATYQLPGFRDKASVIYNVPRNYDKKLVDRVREKLQERAERSNRDQSEFKVLWAGRLDEEKRIDLLPEIAKLNPKLQIHVFGKAVVGTEAAFKGKPENLYLRGPFSSLEDIFEEEFDAFVFTSRWEGLPNILLEVGLHGVPCIAATVGGVAEVITPETGYPLPERATAADYVYALGLVQQDPQESARRAARLIDLIEERHNPRAFAVSIGEIPFYLDRIAL